MQPERSPLDSDRAVTINAHQRDLLLDVAWFLISPDIEAYFVGGEVDKFREARRNMEYAFSLLDDLGWGEPERVSYTVRVTPPLEAVLRTQRESARALIAYDHDRLAKAEAHEPASHGLGRTFDETAAATRRVLDDDLEQLHVLDTILKGSWMADAGQAALREQRDQERG
jgi:hypothetical protein